MYVFHLTSCPHLSIVTASTDLGMRKGKGTAALGSRHVEWKTEAGYPLSECQEDPVPPRRVGGLWYSESPLIKRGKKCHLFLFCLPSPFQIHPFFTLVKCHQLRIESKILKMWISVVKCGLSWWRLWKPKANPCTPNSRFIFRRQCGSCIFKML